MVFPCSRKGHVAHSQAETETYEPRYEKTCLIPYANNKGADQPAH